MEAQWQEALAYLVVLVGVGKVFSETFGSTLEGLNEAIISAGRIESRFKPAVNYGLAILLMAAVTAVLAGATGGDWFLIPGGVLVGVMVARAADAEHQVKKALLGETGAGPDTPTGSQAQATNTLLAQRSGR